MGLPDRHETQISHSFELASNTTIYPTQRNVYTLPLFFEFQGKTTLMADRVTCCPHCSTSFRITDDQLKTAKGAVRCGSCLQIFRALDHLQEEEISTEETSAATPEESIPELDDFSDDALISDDMDQIEDTQSLALGELSDDFLQQGSFGENKGSLFDREIKVRENQDNDHTDESWAVNLLDEIENEEDVPAPPAASKSDDSALSLEDPLDIQETLGTGEDSDTDYSRATTGTFDAITDEELEQTLNEAPSRREPIFNVTGERDIDAAESSTDDEISALFADDHAIDDGHTEDTSDYRQDEHDDLLHAIAPAPVEMEWHAEKSRWPMRVLWASLSLLAIVALVTQFLWFNFDDYSRKQPWRDGFAQLCPMLGCSLPSLAAPEKVKAYNLVVRSHPRADNALIIDSILLNKASFEQPFPDFSLSFSDLQGKPLAHRRFKPSEYLGGELAGAKTMPAGQPVHISLEVLDPGPDAVNYRATIPLN
ncbi:MAG: hypothetical protein CL693_07315 [Cellvibrionaceae bacterium]|nr:hypothetical protein [Cellvibrionaceae bacterium]|tara:strand:+ start:7706 stop:9151 length:1446 start_codon:yes stop_codon:yes gene_type:complete